MSQTASFCTNCGAPLKPGNRFCGSCGQAVDQVAAAPTAAQAAAPVAPATPVVAPPPPPAQYVQPAAPTAPTEPFLGTVGNLRQRKGFMGVKAESYNMIITPARLVFAFVSQQTMKDEVTEAQREAKSEGKKWLGIVAAQMGWLNRLLAKYNQMTVDAILAQYPGSFVISNAEVKKIRLGASSDEDSNIQGEMTIETLSAKHKFELVSVQPQDAKRLLQQTLGALVK